MKKKIIYRGHIWNDYQKGIGSISITELNSFLNELHDFWFFKETNNQHILDELFYAINKLKGLLNHNYPKDPMIDFEFRLTLSYFMLQIEEINNMIDSDYNKKLGQTGK